MADRSERNKAILNQFAVMEERITELENEIRQSDDEILKELFAIEKECLTKKLQQIQSAVMRLDNVHERRMIWLHYIGEINNGKRVRLKIWQIANRMNYSFDWAKKVNASAIKNLNFDKKDTK